MWLCHGGEVALPVAEVLQDLVQWQMVARVGMEESYEAVQEASNHPEHGEGVKDVMRPCPTISHRERELSIIPDGAEDDVGDSVHWGIAVADEEHTAYVVMRGVSWQHGEHPDVEAMDGAQEGHLQRPYIRAL